MRRIWILTEAADLGAINSGAVGHGVAHAREGVRRLCGGSTICLENLEGQRR